MCLLALRFRVFDSRLNEHENPVLIPEQLGLLAVRRVDFRVQNTGEIPLNYESIEISIDGNAQTVDAYSQSLSSGEVKRETALLTNQMTVSNGEHEMTIRLLNGGTTVVEKTVTVSTSN